MYRVVKAERALEELVAGGRRASETGSKHPGTQANEGDAGPEVSFLGHSGPWRPRRWTLFCANSSPTSTPGPKTWGRS
jgi:hypothetical protein